MERMATCSCGQLTVRCAGDPISVSLCHCLACQKRTGSTYGIAAFFTRDQLHTSGQERCYTRPSDSGFDITFRFCPELRFDGPPPPVGTESQTRDHRRCCGSLRRPDISAAIKGRLRRTPPPLGQDDDLRLNQLRRSRPRSDDGGAQGR